jgi:hypothetical protein
MSLVENRKIRSVLAGIILAGCVFYASGSVADAVAGGQASSGRYLPFELTRLDKGQTAKNKDGTYTTVFLVRVAHCTKGLTITIKAPHLVPPLHGQIVTPDGGGAYYLKEKAPYSQTIQSLAEKYRIWITTATPDGADFDSRCED